MKNEKEHIQKELFELKEKDSLIKLNLENNVK